MDFLERVEQLPTQAKDFFKSDEIRLTIERVALAFGVPDGKTPILAAVVSRVFLSELDLVRMNDEIVQQSGLEKKIVNGICLELTKQIFQSFPEVFKDIESAKKTFAIEAAAPILSPAEVEKALLALEPWLGTEAPRTVLEHKTRSTTLDPQTRQILRLPVLRAMSEYQHLSEQLLTEQRIKLKSSPEPARPSLGNWIKAYREVLGVGLHDPVQRAEFLFQSSNTQSLSNEDRARLNLILKSIEEGFPLEIDTKRQVIVFPRAEDTSMELAQVQTRPLNRVILPRGVGVPMAPNRGAATVSPEAPKPAGVSQVLKPLFTKASAPEKNVSGETLRFSTGHVLPAERETEVSSDRNAALRQIDHPTQAIRRDSKPPLARSPYSIRPLRPRNGDEAAECTVNSQG